MNYYLQARNATTSTERHSNLNRNIRGPVLPCSWQQLAKLTRNGINEEERIRKKLVDDGYVFLEEYAPRFKKEDKFKEEFDQRMLSTMAHQGSVSEEPTPRNTDDFFHGITYPHSQPHGHLIMGPSVGVESQTYKLFKGNKAAKSRRKGVSADNAKPRASLRKSTFRPTHTEELKSTRMTQAAVLPERITEQVQGLLAEYRERSSVSERSRVQSPRSPGRCTYVFCDNPKLAKRCLLDTYDAFQRFLADRDNKDHDFIKESSFARRASISQPVDLEKIELEKLAELCPVLPRKDDLRNKTAGVHVPPTNLPRRSPTPRRRDDSPFQSIFLPGKGLRPSIKEMKDHQKAIKELREREGIIDEDAELVKHRKTRRTHKAKSAVPKFDSRRSSAKSAAIKPPYMVRSWRDKLEPLKDEVEINVIPCEEEIKPPLPVNPPANMLTEEHFFRPEYADGKHPVGFVHDSFPVRTLHPATKNKLVAGSRKPSAGVCKLSRPGSAKPRDLVIKKKEIQKKMAVEEEDSKSPSRSVTPADFNRPSSGESKPAHRFLYNVARADHYYRKWKRRASPDPAKEKSSKTLSAKQKPSKSASHKSISALHRSSESRHGGRNLHSAM